MDDKIYNYKEKGKQIQNNQLNLKKTKNFFKKDIQYISNKLSLK